MTERHMIRNLKWCAIFALILGFALLMQSSYDKGHVPGKEWLDPAVTRPADGDYCIALYAVWGVGPYMEPVARLEPYRVMYQLDEGSAHWVHDRLDGTAGAPLGGPYRWKLVPDCPDRLLEALAGRK
jgi:hypothetical protein